MTDFRALCAELVEVLSLNDYYDEQAGDMAYRTLLQRARAALAQPEPEGATPQPVPVSERLPGPGDCDAEGMCWLCGKVEGDWRLLNPEKSGLPQLKYCFSHWLPAHALPLPNHTSENV